MKRMNLDQLGAVASTVCAVHCLLTGLALGLLSVAGLGFVASEPAEYIFLGVAVTVGLAALIHGHRRHHSMIPAWIFVLGIGLLIVRQFAFPHSHDSTEVASGGELAKTIVSVAAGLALVAFHLVNQRMQHQCGGKHCSHHH